MDSSMFTREIALPPLRRHGDRPLPGEHLGGPVQQHVNGPLGVEGGDPVDVVEGAHELPVGVEGQLSQPGVLGR